jgi:hypothetical protein
MDVLKRLAGKSFWPPAKVDIFLVPGIMLLYFEIRRGAE